MPTLDDARNWLRVAATDLTARYIVPVFVDKTGDVHGISATGIGGRVAEGTPVYFVAEVAATGTLTGTTIAADDTVLIGDTTYTFVAAVSSPFDVLVGASDSDSLDNLISAINGGAGEGTIYGTGTTAHPLVTAAAGAGDTMDVTAKTAGTDGNAITTVSGLTSGAFAAFTLEGGVDGVLATTAVAGDQLIDGTYLYTAISDIATDATTGWYAVAVTPLEDL